MNVQNTEENTVNPVELVKADSEDITTSIQKANLPSEETKSRLIFSETVVEFKYPKELPFFRHEQAVSTVKSKKGQIEITQEELDRLAEVRKRREEYNKEKEAKKKQKEEEKKETEEKKEKTEKKRDFKPKPKSKKKNKRR